MPNASRRSFLGALIKGIGVFSILPPASTYGRIWKATKPDLVPFWEQTIYSDDYLAALNTAGIRAQLEACAKFGPPLPYPPLDEMQKAFSETVFTRKRIGGFKDCELLTYA